MRLKEAAMNRPQTIARTATIILTGAMIASGFSLLLSGPSAGPFDISLSKGIASLVATYFS